MSCLKLNLRILVFISGKIALVACTFSFKSCETNCLKLVAAGCGFAFWFVNNAVLTIVFILLELFCEDTHK